jgi:hypothetical protein
VRFQAALALAAGRQGRVEVSVVDVPTGRRLDGPQPQVPLRSASVIKVAIAVMVLGRGRPLSRGQRVDLAAMIENSDNDAAQRLWNLGGGAAGLTALARRLDLRATVADPEGAWGFTLTTAQDLATLGLALADGVALDPAGTATLLDLMRHVESDQAWGIAAAVRGGAPAIKNGWYPDDDRDDWRVHCLGLIGDPPTSVLSIMTVYPESLGQAYGERTCQMVAAAALDPGLTRRPTVAEP